MSNLNAAHNRVVWVDIPVKNLDRAIAFYAAVLGIAVHKESFDKFTFAVLDHKDGNGGCLVEKPDDVSMSGTLIYLNANGRIRDAVGKVETNGGKVLQPIHGIGPHGFRAVIVDSEGNRMALHSEQDV